LSSSYSLSLTAGSCHLVWTEEYVHNCGLRGHRGWCGSSVHPPQLPHSSIFAVDLSTCLRRAWLLCLLWIARALYHVRLHDAVHSLCLSMCLLGSCVSSLSLSVSLSVSLCLSVSRCLSVSLCLSFSHYLSCSLLMNDYVFCRPNVRYVAVCTAEGDNMLLKQQTTKFLLKV
jgi:hypothetical protein